jgi:hypothetical protein
MSVAVDPIQRVAGDALRAVAVYDEHEPTIVYEREDVSNKPKAIDDIHQELILDGMGVEYLEDLFQVGDLKCTMHRFEEAVCIHFSRAEFNGLFVSVDTNAGVDLETLAEVCDEATV